MTEPILIVRAKGPATEGGRIALRDLLELGKHVQAAVERVARVLRGQMDSRRPGRKPPEIAQECPLQVVALNRGSFEIGFDLPRGKLDTMHLGLEGVEKLLQGLEFVGGDGGELPTGYDAGVLYSLRDMGGVLSRGIDEIEFESRAQDLPRRFSFDRKVYRRVAERIRAPVKALRTLEGRLLMADFRETDERCRIHPPLGAPVVCHFDEALEETVYQYLRRYVRVTGEMQEDPTTGRISSIRISDIEPVSVDGEDFGAFTAETFWQESSLEQLSAEQGVGPVLRFEDVWGKGADLWSDDDDFAAFLSATRGVQNGGA